MYRQCLPAVFAFLFLGLPLATGGDKAELKELAETFAKSEDKFSIIKSGSYLTKHGTKGWHAIVDGLVARKTLIDYCQDAYLCDCAGVILPTDHPYVSKLVPMVVNFMARKNPKDSMQRQQIIRCIQFLGRIDPGLAKPALPSLEKFAASADAIISLNAKNSIKALEKAKEKK